jgi:hypothetical protein
VIDDEHQPRLGEVVTRMNSLGRTEVRSAVRDLLDKLDTSSRFAFLKLVTGALRIGVSARLAKQALSDMSGKDVAEIETLWHGLTPPYEPLFAWLEGRAEKPVLATPAIFHSVMLANPVETGDLEKLDPADYAAEWKWDGIRVQMSSYGGTKKLYSRSGDDITGAFPDVVGSINFEGVIDGELLVGGTARSNNPTRTFSDLQQRLNRKTVTAKMLDDYPAFVRAYDLLFESDLDIRAEEFSRAPQTPRRHHPAGAARSVRPLRSRALHHLGRARPHPRRATRSGHRRGDDQAQGQPIPGRPSQGAVVQVEAGPLQYRRGDALRPARPRQAVELLFRLHLRRLGRDA